jgi:predicted amidohydrolase YtcJ
VTAPADRILTNAAVRTLADDTPGPDAEAVAIRDGEIVGVGSTYELDFLAGVETDRIDLDGRTLVPGFVDAHTHLELLGQHQREADLAGASRSGCLDRLCARRDETDGWVLGFGYEESEWDETTYLTREDLDAVSTTRPVAAFREDGHLVSVNSVVLDRYGDEFPAENVHRDGGEPTGVLVEGALDTIREVIRPDREQMRTYLLTAQEYALERGVTTVHEMVRRSHAPRVYRELDRAGDLTLRVRLNYWADHLDAVLEAGLAPNHGSDRVRTGGIKTFVDGSIGSRTARLSEPYADSPATETDTHDGTNDEGRGEWVTPPDELAELVERVDDAGLQMTMHAIGDVAIATALDALEGTSGERHRIEHAEVLTDELIERLAASDVVVSMQPNYLKWAGEGGLYDSRLGPSRRRASNRFGALADAGAQLAFGSDCMPLDPLFGIHQAINAPDPAQRLGVTEAMQAYTAGGAAAGFDEHRLGTIEVGTCADLVALSGSPWDTDDIDALDVDLTLVGGNVAYDGRSKG